MGDGIIQQLNDIETSHKIEYLNIQQNRIEILINPSLFRQIEQIVKDKDGYFLEILQQIYSYEHDNNIIEQEYSTNKPLLSKVEQEEQQQLSLDNLSLLSTNKQEQKSKYDDN